MLKTTILDIKGNWITLKGKPLGRKQQIPICITFVFMMVIMITMIPLNSHAHSMTDHVLVMFSSFGMLCWVTNMFIDIISNQDKIIMITI
jgi:hypothetical protein